MAVAIAGCLSKDRLPGSFSGRPLSALRDVRQSLSTSWRRLGGSAPSSNVAGARAGLDETRQKAHTHQVVWWAVSIDAEPFGLSGPRLLPCDDAVVHSPQLSLSSRGRGLIALRCSARAIDETSAVEETLAFFERSTGVPLGKVLRTVVCPEGDLNVGGGGGDPAGDREPRHPIPRLGGGRTEAPLL